MGVKLNGSGRVRVEVNVAFTQRRRVKVTGDAGGVLPAARRVRPRIELLDHLAFLGGRRPAAGVVQDPRRAGRAGKRAPGAV